MTVTNYTEYIMNLKKQQQYNNCFRLIGLLKDEIQEAALKSIVQDKKLTDQMRNDYFPNSIDILCKRMIDATGNCSIFELLKWATEVFQIYHEQINNYLRTKEEYEKSLFSENYEVSQKLLYKIEKKVCFSIWGINQRFLVLNLQGKQSESIKLLNELQLGATQNSFAAFLLFYYEKMSDKSISFDEYIGSVQNVLENGGPKDIIWRYFEYKLNIVSEASVQSIKAALVIDEQFSLIDFYETYIDAIQILSSNDNLMFLINQCIKSLYKSSIDFRIRNLFLTQEKVDKHITINKNISLLIEKYTCGKYSDLKADYIKHVEEFRADFNLNSLFLKAGIDTVDNNTTFNDLWSEIYDIYNFKHDISSSMQKLGGYYKLFYGTSWRYKILGILVRKLNFEYEDNILRISILNDNILTPLFHQVINDKTKQIEYLNLFNSVCPITTQLHLYMLTDYVNENSIKQIDSIRWIYYEIKQLVSKSNYPESIIKCMEFLKVYGDGADRLYYQERIRRILFSCYILTNEYILAMNVYVDSYIISKELTFRMPLIDLIDKIEELSEDNEEIRANIFRPIILRLYYKNANDDVISAYLDYLESQKCKTIIDLIENREDLNEYELIFLNKVCTQSLLMKDYVSKSLIGATAAELRAIILRTLIKFEKSGQKEYLSELNSIYKSNQLQKRINSFNHNRIFIDKQNLLKYLRDSLNQEFLKYNSVQEIKKALNGSKEKLKNYTFFVEQYWDDTKFIVAIVEKIKKAYLNESPYSLEDFLSTRIRHNYCNDNLKKVFDNEKLFSKKAKDDSPEYIVNDYWMNKLTEHEYNVVIGVLSRFSQIIDNKIQEIKDKWIRIKKDDNREGLFDYDNCIIYIHDYVNYLDNIEEFFYAVIGELDKNTNQILMNIREKIDCDLKPYYYDAITELESDIRKLNFDVWCKNEMLRRIEITKAKYIEDIEAFKDIFNIEYEKYPDFSMDELIEFCCKIENNMNNQFHDENVIFVDKYKKKLCGHIFPFLVDIIAILIRNAVQHSQITKMDDLMISISIEPYESSTVKDIIIRETASTVSEESNYSVILKVTNNLSSKIDTNEIREQIREKIDNINNGKYRKDSNKEGGSGLYKIARTVYYSLYSSSAFYYYVSDEFCEINIAMDLNQFEVSE